MKGTVSHILRKSNMTKPGYHKAINSSSIIHLKHHITCTTKYIKYQQISHSLSLSFQTHVVNPNQNLHTLSPKQKKKKHTHMFARPVGLLTDRKNSDLCCLLPQQYRFHCQLSVTCRQQYSYASVKVSISRRHSTVAYSGSQNHLDQALSKYWGPAPLL